MVRGSSASKPPIVNVMNLDPLLDPSAPVHVRAVRQADRHVRVCGRSVEGKKVQQNLCGNLERNT